MATLNWVAVSSSNVARVAWDDEGLHVEFHNMRQYRYLGVPKELYLELLNAPSKGKFLNAHIKGSFFCPDARHGR